MSKDELSESFKYFIENNVGISRKQVWKITPHTRLYHDLDVYGDIASWFVDAMVAEGVDMRQFEFNKYFPPEHYGVNFFSRFVYWGIPFLKYFKRKRETYSPLSMETIQNALQSKRWSDRQ